MNRERGERESSRKEQLIERERREGRERERERERELEEGAMNIEREERES